MCHNNIEDLFNKVVLPSMSSIIHLSHHNMIYIFTYSCNPFKEGCLDASGRLLILGIRATFPCLWITPCERHKCHYLSWIRTDDLPFLSCCMTPMDLVPIFLYYNHNYFIFIHIKLSRSDNTHSVRISHSVFHFSFYINLKNSLVIS